VGQRGRRGGRTTIFRSVGHTIGVRDRTGGGVSAIGPKAYCRLTLVVTPLETALLLLPEGIG
jgi:hypothetical protein